MRTTMPDEIVIDPVVDPVTPAPITRIDQIPQGLRDQIESAHRKTLQARTTAAEAKATSLESLRGQTASFMEQLGDRITLEEGSDLGDIGLQLTSTLDSMKTEKEKLDAANTKQGERLSASEKAAAGFKQQYESTLVNFATMAELSGKVVEGKAGELVAQELAKIATVGPDGSITFEMDVTDANGHTAKEQVNAETAVAAFEADVKNWGFAFISSVNGGTGEKNEVEGTKLVNGDLDWAAMAKDPTKFFDLMKTNSKAVEDSFNQLE
jgi:hypothetical protein